MPKLTSDSCLIILEGRHLLSELVSENSFVPNNFCVYNYIDEYDKNIENLNENLPNTNYSNRISLITGPNYSGKSIFLK